MYNFQSKLILTFSGVDPSSECQIFYVIHEEGKADIYRQLLPIPPGGA